MSLAKIGAALKDSRMLLAALGVLFGGGFYAYGQVRDVARSEAETVIRPLSEVVKIMSTDLDRHRADEDLLQREMRDLREDLHGLRNDLKKNR